MRNKVKDSVNFLDLDIFPNTPAISRINCKGEGRLIQPNGKKFKCHVLIKRLINGRLQVFASLDNQINTSVSYRLECETATDYKLTGDDLKFNQQNLFTDTNEHFIYSGFINRLIYRSNKRCYKQCKCIYQLTNSHWNLISTIINIGGFLIKMRLITPGGIMSQGDINDIKSSYKTNAISNELLVENVKKSQIKDLDELVSTLVFLMSFANRGYLFTCLEKRATSKDDLIFLNLKEPVFLRQGWSRQLIYPKDLGHFLETTYDKLLKKNMDFELRMAIDHYLQALTLRSAWSISLGIFTALESINSAFYHKNLNDQKMANYFWIADDKKFKNECNLLDDLIEVLANHFPRFSKLQKPEKNSLKSQLSWINRRSYKTQLVFMLKVLKVKFDMEDVRTIVKIRNKIIHSGAPSFSEDSDFYNKSADAWEHVQRAANLFEKIVLAILEYEGEYEPFNPQC